VTLTAAELLVVVTQLLLDTELLVVLELLLDTELLVVLELLLDTELLVVLELLLLELRAELLDDISTHSR
jgi:hypothetical protein